MHCASTHHIDSLWASSLLSEEQKEKRKLILDEEEAKRIVQAGKEEMKKRRSGLYKVEGGDGLSESLKPFHLSLEHIICTIFHWSTCTTLR